MLVTGGIGVSVLRVSSIIYVFFRVKGHTSCSCALAWPRRMGFMRMSSSAAVVALAASLPLGRTRTRILPGCKSVCCSQCLVVELQGL